MGQGGCEKVFKAIDGVYAHDSRCFPVTSADLGSIGEANQTKDGLPNG